MNDYIEVRFEIDPCDETITDILAALLAERGFESFVPDHSGLTAYIARSAYEPQATAEAIDEMPFDNLTVTTDVKTVEGQDWNAEWEKNYFQPIVIGNKCVVHSSFHTNVPEAEHDIVIDPKMAFGTGHHATTSLIIEQLLETDINGLDVIDMGTGTAILAILAAMRGCRRVAAIEIDEFAAVNARENLKPNGVDDRINVIDGDASALEAVPFKANLFMANINRNVIVADLARYAESMAPGATVLFSGFYEADAPIVAAEAARFGITETGRTVRDNWCCLKLRRS